MKKEASSVARITVLFSKLVCLLFAYSWHVICTSYITFDCFFFSS